MTGAGWSAYSRLEPGTAVVLNPGVPAAYAEVMEVLQRTDVIMVVSLVFHSRFMRHLLPTGEAEDLA